MESAATAQYVLLGAPLYAPIRRSCGTVAGTSVLQVLDLFGDREPLTKDTAEEALAPLFAPKLAITTVCLTPPRLRAYLALFQT